MTLAKFNKILAVLFSFITIILFIYNKEAQILLFLIYIIIPFILKIKPAYTTLYLIFGFLAVLLGFLLHFYKIITWYDTLIHFLWGIVSSMVSILILIQLKMYNEKELLFNILFAIMFSLATACLWEVVEYVIDTIFNTDLQRRATGVHNTMKDIIVAILGNILFIIWYFYEYKFKTKLLIRKYIDLL